MVEIGYFLSSEEHGPTALVEQARMAADAGMRSVWISDHYHPWIDAQGESPFVWSVIGAIAATTDLRVTTAVTCPTMRIHPAVVAQAAATSSLLLAGRFELGVGSGENLNEHIFGDYWPPTDIRLEMLEEAVQVMRKLWSGDEISHHGTHYTVEDARIYSRPEHPVPVLVSGFGPKATEVAARIGEGYVQTSPDKELVDLYKRSGGQGPITGAMKLCWGEDEHACAELAHKLWKSSGLAGQLAQELRTPKMFEDASELVTVEMTAKATPCGPAVEPIVEQVQKYVDAGFDRVYLNQIGPNQKGFFDFYTRELQGALTTVARAA